MRLIYEDAFVSNVVKSGFGAEFINRVTGLLIDIPTIELKQGEWITIWDSDDPDTSHEGRCSECGRVSKRPLGDFCKWCGARMFDKDTDVPNKRGKDNE